MSKTIKEMTEYVHSIAKSHGFWEDSDEILRNYDSSPSTVSMIFAQKIALIHSELSEALEADRKGKWANYTGKYKEGHEYYLEECKEWFLSNIKDSVEDEIADAAIRIMDLCGYLGIDLQWHIEKKAEYNNSRPYKHGKSY